MNIYVPTCFFLREREETELACGVLESFPQNSDLQTVVYKLLKIFKNVYLISAWLFKFRKFFKNAVTKNVPYELSHFILFKLRRHFNDGFFS